MTCFAAAANCGSVLEGQTHPALLHPMRLKLSVRHINCLTEAPVTLKTLISVSLNVYLEVHHILCTSHDTFQKSAWCPCHCTVTLLVLLTVLTIIANSAFGFENILTVCFKSRLHMEEVSTYLANRDLS